MATTSSTGTTKTTTAKAAAAAAEVEADTSTPAAVVDGDQAAASVPDAAAETVVPGHDGSHDGEPIVAVVDRDGKTHYASAGSKFVADGLAKGTLKPAAAKEIEGDVNGPAAS